MTRTLAQRLLDSRATPNASESTGNGAGTVVASVSILDHHRIRELAQLDALANSLHVGTAYFEPHRRIGAARIARPGGEALSFSSFDYLGLTDDPRVRAAACDATLKYGTSTSSARIVGGEIDLYRELEIKLAGFLGTDDALIFTSGYLTNVAFLSYLLDSNDVILTDSLVHHSVVAGTESSPARRLSFNHNDVAHLDSLLEKVRSRHRYCIVAIDSVYSMDGDIAPLVDIVEVCNRYGAQLYVDEAHSLGVLGKTGRGIFEHFDIDVPSDAIVMGTLSKALGSFGGFAAGNGSLLRAVRQFAPGASLFCTSMPPAICAAAIAGLDVLVQEPQRVRRVQTKAAFFQKELQNLGIDTGMAQGTTVVPVMVRDSLKAVRLSQLLSDDGIIAYAIFHPAVADGESRLRFFVTDSHSEDDLRSTAQIVARHAASLGLTL